MLTHVFCAGLWIYLLWFWFYEFILWDCGRNNSLVMMCFKFIQYLYHTWLWLIIFQIWRDLLFYFITCWIMYFFPHKRNLTRTTRLWFWCFFLLYTIEFLLPNFVLLTLKSLSLSLSNYPIFFCRRKGPMKLSLKQWAEQLIRLWWLLN